MGYYTYFALEVEAPDRETELAINKRFTELFGFDPVAKRVLNPTLEDYDHVIEDILGADSYKWYDYHEDMRILSEEFPTTRFTLWGDGEESDDKWVAYYLGGKGREFPAEIRYPDSPLW